MTVPSVPNQNQSRNLAQLIANLGPQSKLLEHSKVDPRGLAAGIKPSFASLTFKGKTWGIRHRGVTTQLLARGPQGEIYGAIPTIDVIIVKSATAISKTYYIEKYKEGDFAQPDCWSTNGLKPDPASAKKQNETCRGCKWDAFGSRTMEDGRKGKACSDNKRIAVVPATDIKNEAFGGPMLLKLPPSSFAGLSELEVQLHMQGYRYDGLVIRLSFDHEAAFPKIMFTPVGVLNDHQVQEVINLQDSDVTDRILNEEVSEVTGDPVQATADNVVPLKPTPTQQHHAEMVQPQTQAFNPTVPPLGAPQVTSSPQGETKAPIVTAEQQRIADLEAQLQALKEAKPRRRRAAPVTPTGPQPTQQAVPASNGVDEGDEEEGDEPADLQSRIDNLLKPTGGTPTS